MSNTRSAHHIHADNIIALAEAVKKLADRVLALEKCVACLLKREQDK